MDKQTVGLPDAGSGCPACAAAVRPCAYTVPGKQTLPALSLHSLLLLLLLLPISSSSSSSCPERRGWQLAEKKRGLTSASAFALRLPASSRRRVYLNLVVVLLPPSFSFPPSRPFLLLFILVLIFIFASSSCSVALSSAIPLPVPLLLSLLRPIQLFSTHNYPLSAVSHLSSVSPYLQLCGPAQLTAR